MKKSCRTGPDFWFIAMQRSQLILALVALILGVAQAFTGAFAPVSPQLFKFAQTPCPGWRRREVRKACYEKWRTGGCVGAGWGHGLDVYTLQPLSH